MERLHADERRRLYARAFQIAELLAEDACPAEGHAERRRGEREYAPARSEHGAAVRRFPKPRAQPSGGLPREEQPEKLFERPQDIQVGECERQNVKRGDKSAHAQDGDDRAVHALVQNIVGGGRVFFRRRFGQGL